MHPSTMFGIIWVGGIVSWIVAAFWSARGSASGQSPAALARVEERFLTAELGAEAYDTYRRRVPMLVSFMPAA